MFTVIRLVMAALVCLFAASYPRNAGADENLFGYVYGSDTLPAGGTEIYNWLTFRTGKGKGTYRGWDEQVELEHGFTDRLQASLYLKGRSHQIKGGALDDDPDRKLYRGLEFNGVNVAFQIQPPECLQRLVWLVLLPRARLLENSQNYG